MIQTGGRASHARASLGAVVAAGLAFAAYVSVAPGPVAQVELVDNLVQLLVPLLVTVPLTVRAARRGTGRARLAWMLLAGAAFAWGGGQALWAWSATFGREALPYPSAADVGFLGAVPLLLAGVVCYPTRNLKLIGGARAFLDGSILATVLLFICFGTFLDGAQAEAHGSILSWVLAVIYPVSDVIAAGVVVAVLVRRAERWSGPLPVVGAGVVSLALADTAFAVATTSGSYSGVAITDVGWPVGFLLIGIATLWPDEPHADALAVGPDRVDLTILFPYLPVLPALVVFVARTASGLPISPLLAVTGSVAVSLVVGRQVVTLFENRQLTGDMAAALAALRLREEELEHRAFHDPLTGLANRSLLRDRLEHALTGRTAAPVGLLFIDLDDFKTVNDSLGHDVGDRLLEHVADRLRACVRAEDTIARLGGDEFAILLGPGRTPGAGPGEDLAPAGLAERVLESLGSPFRLADRDLRVGASIGVVPASLPGATAEEVLQDADLAMYAAKAAGKGRCERFEPLLRTRALDRLELVADLRVAAERDELLLHFQPIVDLETFDVLGHESLIRWQHPTRGFLPPAAFIQLAEEIGAIEHVGAWALERACTTAASWSGALASATVAVNLSALQLADPSFVHVVASALERTGLDPHRLELEITESVLLTDDALAGRLRDLRRLGVRLAIDDFGTGYSSLSYLARLPVDVVKIDRSFVEGLGVGGDVEVLVRSVVRLAADLGLRAVGEGIETIAQLEALQALGCHAGQGYLLAGPAPLAVATIDPALLGHATAPSLRHVPLPAAAG